MLLSMLWKIGNIISNVTEDLSFLAKCTALVVAFFAPIDVMVLVLMAFVILDMLSAVYLTYKMVLKKTENKLNGMGGARRKLKCVQIFYRVFKPKKFRLTIEKLFAYPVVLMVCYVFDIYVLDTDPGVEGVIRKFSTTNLAFILITLMDFKSFLRNMGKATGNEAYMLIEGVISKKIKYFSRGSKNNKDKASG